MEIKLKRAYNDPAKTDGYRVLVDRLWPRGVKKEALQLDEWDKDVSPSTDLRRWFGHDPDKFREFTSRYRDELKESGAAQALLERIGKRKQVTLVYGARDTEHNEAVVLKDYLEALLKQAD